MYKKFKSLKAAIDENNFRLATHLEATISENELSPASRRYFLALKKRIPSIIQNEARLHRGVQPATLAEYDNFSTQPGVSIVSCCMNRNTNLLKALKTWIKLPVDEIVIVDWSSEIPVIESIKDLNDDRIKVLRVENEANWILTCGFNVGLRFAGHSKIFKFDADVEVSEDFLEMNEFDSDQFIRGYWKSALDEGLDSQVYVNGSFGAHKKNLKEIGYYNELIRTYGWDDSDLYERLASQCGLGTIYLDLNSILHLEQEEFERIAHQDVVTSNFLGLVPPTDFNNQRNKFIARTTDEWSTRRLQNYNIEKTAPALWNLERVTQPIAIASHIINDANAYSAHHFLWARRAEVAKKSNAPIDLAKFLFSEYEANISHEITLIILGEINQEHIVCCFDRHQSYGDFIRECRNISEREDRIVYAMSLSDDYSHKRFGDIDAFVEVLALPSELFSALSTQREKNRLPPLMAETAFIATTELASVFSQYFKPKVYIDAQHGLGNRLRAIGSAAAIANKTGRELVIVWQSDHHCECEFSDLFDYSGKVIAKSFVGDADKFMDLFNYMEIEQGSQKGKPVKIDDDKHLYFRAAYTLVHEASHWESENKFIKALKPSKQVLDLIAPFNVGSHVAVHIRMEAGAGLDRNTYDSVENWAPEGHEKLHYWRKKSHYSAFINRIDELIEEDSNLKLFLAADLQATYDIFEQYYGDRLVFLKRDVFDRSKKQMTYASADLLLLSKCEKLLGSTWSSFSEAALRLSNTYSRIEMSGVDFK